MTILEKIKNNLPLTVVVVLAVILLLLSNGVTYFSLDNVLSKSRRELREEKRQKDSVIALNRLMDKKISEERWIQDKLRREDSLYIAHLEELQQDDQRLIREQARDIARYKGRTNSQLLNAIDSAYEANN